MESIIVVDIGTSSIRGILISTDGDFLFISQKASEPNFIDSTRVEQPVESWRDNLSLIFDDISSFMQSSNTEVIVKCISITSQRSSLIILDINNDPLGPAIMWQDKRTIDIIRDLKAIEPKVFQKTGSPLNPVYLAPKILWIQKNNQEITHKAKTYLSIADYVAFSMTEKFQTDWTYASRTSLMNIREKSWDKYLLNLFETNLDNLCSLIAPGSVLGRLQNVDFVKFPFFGVPVVSAGGDQQNAALGLGLIEEGDCEINLGTGAYILSLANQLPDQFNKDVVFNSYCLADKYVLETNLITCGSLIDWTKRVFFPELEIAEFYHQLDIAITDEASSVIVHPYFQGRGAPDWNSNATGSIFGLNLSTTRTDIINGIIDGICFEIKLHIELMEKYIGKNVKTIKVAGGLGKNQKIMQKLANILQKELLTYSNSEATAIGAYIQAVRALNESKSVKALYDSVRAKDTITCFQPDPNFSDKEIEIQYQYFQNQYEKLYRIKL